MLDYAPCRFTYSSKLEIGWSVQDLERCPWDNGNKSELLIVVPTIVSDESFMRHWDIEKTEPLTEVHGRDPVVFAGGRCLR